MDGRVRGPAARGCAAHIMRSWIRHVAIAGLAIALIAVFLRNANLAQVWQVMRGTRLELVLLGVACVFATYVFRARRWQVMLSPMGPTHFGVALRATIIGFAASFVLPARAGEVLRPWLLARREGMDTAAVLATIVLERVLDLICVIVLLAIFLLAFDPGLSALDPAMFRTVRAGGLAAAAAAAVGMLVMFACASRPDLLERLTHWATGWLPERPRHLLGALAATFGRGLASVRKPRVLAAALGWSVPLWITIALQIWIVSIALGVALPLTGSMLVTAILVVGVAVPTPGAVGGFHEAYRIAVTTFFGADNDHAVGAAIVLHAVGFLPTLAVGTWLMAREGVSFGSLGAASSATAAAASAGPQEARP